MSDLDRQATGADEPDFDYDHPPFCSKCGSEKDWTDCWQIDCEEGRYDLSEEDCINYAPGTYATCETCEGKGGWWYCPACPSSNGSDR